MKKSFGLILLSIVSLAAMSSVAFSAEPAPAYTWEFSGGTNGTFNHAFGNGNSGAVNQYTLAIGADYFVMPQLEVGFDGGIVLASSSGATVSKTILAVGPVYNFSTDIENSFYAKADIGINFDHLDGVNTFTSVYFLVGIGRRVEIVQHVSWSPFVGFEGHGSSSSNGVSQLSQTQLDIIPVQFSVAF